MKYKFQRRRGLDISGFCFKLLMKETKGMGRKHGTVEMGQ